MQQVVPNPLTKSTDVRFLVRFFQVETPLDRVTMGLGMGKQPSPGGGPTFIKASFTLRFGDRKLPVHAFISEHGAFHVLDQEKYTDYTGRIVTVEVSGTLIPGRLIREFSGVHCYYNVKFHFEAETQKKALLEFLKNHQIEPPPWERKYPRFGTQSVAALGATVPAHAVVKTDNFHYPYIINFTLGGILVETQGKEMESCRPAQIHNFDIQLTDGSLIKSLSGRVVRVNEDAPPFDGRTFRQIAFEMSVESQNNAIYKSLIRACLQTLTKK